MTVFWRLIIVSSVYYKFKLQGLGSGCPRFWLKILLLQPLQVLTFDFSKVQTRRSEQSPQQSSKNHRPNVTSPCLNLLLHRHILEKAWFFLNAVVLVYWGLGGIQLALGSAASQSEPGRTRSLSGCRAQFGLRSFLLCTWVLQTRSEPRLKETLSNQNPALSWSFHEIHTCVHANERSVFSPGSSNNC